MTDTRQLFVTWRSPKTRRIHPVGRLTYSPTAGDYRFGYIRGVADAQKEGFTPFPEFPGLTVAYESRQLFPLFSTRVMTDTRPDFKSYLSDLGIENRLNTSFDILERTGGTRSTDLIELIPSPAKDRDGCFVAYCLLRGIRHMEQPERVEATIRELKKGDPLRVEPDPANEADPNALVVLSLNDVRLGYLPRYLLADLHALISQCPGGLTVCVERVNPPPAEPHHRLLCKVTACWPEEYSPFSAETFQPLTSGASASE